MHNTISSKWQKKRNHCLIVKWLSFFEVYPILTTPLNVIFIPLVKLIAFPPINAIFEAKFISIAVFFIKINLNNLATWSFYRRDKSALIFKSIWIIERHFSFKTFFIGQLLLIFCISFIYLLMNAYLISLQKVYEALLKVCMIILHTCYYICKNNKIVYIYIIAHNLDICWRMPIHNYSFK